MTQAKPDRASLYTFLLLLAAFSLVGFKMISPYLLALLMGGILALLSYPLVERLRRKRLGPRAASVVVTVGLLLLVVAPLATFSILAVKEGIELGQKLGENETFSLRSMAGRVSRWGPMEALLGGAGNLERQLVTGLRGSAKYASGAILKLAATVPEFLLQLALACLACYFFLVDGKRFIAWVMARVPLQADLRTRLVDSFRSTAISTIWSGLAAAASQSAVLAVAYLVLGVPGAFFAGGATFILSWIPVVGSTPVWLVGAGYLFAQDAPVKAVLMLGAGVAAGLVDNVVRPWVLKGRDDMHPFIGLVAIIGGIHLFGILGVFIGPILAAVLISLLQIWPVLGRRFGFSFPEE
ncbi:MAG: AI-2E family transporter [Elusimicrobiota bacterium]